nr:MAG TPA: hypothetical protein [Crassvirales sp.]
MFNKCSVFNTILFCSITFCKNEWSSMFRIWSTIVFEILIKMIFSFNCLNLLRRSIT